MRTAPTKVSIALGGGGARGYAHIGVLEELTARDYEVVQVAGTSMGAVVGALFASGNLPEYVEWVQGLRRRSDVVKLVDPNFAGPSAIKIERVLSRVNEIIGIQRIEDMPIDFTAVATDLWARREVWFDSGPIDTAIRASIAIPGVFPPIALNGRLLVDGGVANQVPVSVLASSAAELTVAVTLDGQGSVTQRGKGMPVHASSDEQEARAWSDRLRSRMGKLIETEPMRSIAARMAVRAQHENTGTSVAELFDELPIGLRTSDVATQSLEVLRAIVQRYQLAAFPTDALVVVPNDSIGTMDFHLAVEQIELGRTLAAEAFDRAGMVSGLPNS
ncbi:patatin-like phospholipase family protein [Gulosibacter molinativorax]|uniref:Esterase n=1 Tax=Gulosibacter molinativorax TaxID=256821 RepID=A0ABT7C555_9MICO|nr:patatin-like phospholipase family protein [Gulosibacter molinativorax]MDJ1370315.1 esterase [Gulosibacter molinativorax]